MPPIDTPFKFGAATFVITLFVVGITFGNIFSGVGLALVFGFAGYIFWKIYLKATDQDKKGYFSKMSNEIGNEEVPGQTEHPGKDKPNF